MPFFQYRARDKNGALITGTLEAADLPAIEAALGSRGLIPIKVTAKSSAQFKLPDIAKYFQTIPHQDLILFSRQLATLFAAGVPLTRSLFTLESQMRNAMFVSVIKAVREDVEGGSTFSAALSKHPKVFPELYSNMVVAGEAGGILDSVLDRLAFMLEKNAENRAKVKAATLYPKIVVAAILAAVVIIMKFVIPKFAQLYASFKVELPLPTRILIRLSGYFSSYWYLMLIAVVALVAGARAYISTERGRYQWDRLSIRFPIFGPLLLKSIMSRFSRVLGALYKSGLPILQCLDIVSRAVENKVITAEVKAIEAEVRAGKSISEPMSKSRNIEPMVTQMVRVGEETGNLDDMLEKVAQYYDQEVDTSIRNLTTTLEPILLGFIFAMVLFLALAIFLPMWDILKIVRKG
ncbi:MAG: type II secretion system F family protein [Deltaproteobacteria bacterium]|nr:type II secretion system F family protein [Deltaproteobacteria bacterium]